MRRAAGLGSRGGGGRHGGPGRRPLLAVTAAATVPLVAPLLMGAGTSAAPSEPAPSQDLGTLVMVLDASGSMRRPDAAGQERMASARQAVSTVVAELPGEVPIGLRVFGAGPATRADAQTCGDSQLLVPPAPRSAPDVVEGVGRIAPQGWTPMGFALRSAGEDLARSADSFGTVVLVSDGVDECYPDHGPEPCEVARSMTTGPVQLRVHTVGLVVDEAARQQLQCIARVTGGFYADAADADDLAQALRDSLLPPPPAPTGPPEPPPANLLGTVVAVMVLTGTVLGTVALIRRGNRRRRRRYW